ncbi:hypothetical protein H0E87_028570 [Populus deltoides]|uniref:Uncharacterized protein n=1 Tax=Populus deltoides TaxID=3696 RepID=A0A8T2WWP8_POPDE|nr:hypothetical protein H0E87_028570 [Populus deltoides]
MYRGGEATALEHDRAASRRKIRRVVMVPGCLPLWEEGSPQASWPLRLSAAIASLTVDESLPGMAKDRRALESRFSLPSYRLFASLLFLHLLQNELSIAREEGRVGARRSPSVAGEDEAFYISAVGFLRFSLKRGDVVFRLLQRKGK